MDTRGSVRGVRARSVSRTAAGTGDAARAGVTSASVRPTARGTGHSSSTASVSFHCRTMPLSSTRHTPWSADPTTSSRRACAPSCSMLRRYAFHAKYSGRAASDNSNHAPRLASSARVTAMAAPITWPGTPRSAWVGQRRSGSLPVASGDSTSATAVVTTQYASTAPASGTPCHGHCTGTVEPPRMACATAAAWVAAAAVTISSTLRRRRWVSGGFVMSCAAVASTATKVMAVGPKKRSVVSAATNGNRIRPPLSATERCGSSTVNNPAATAAAAKTPSDTAPSAAHGLNPCRYRPAAVSSATIAASPARLTHHCTAGCIARSGPYDANGTSCCSSYGCAAGARSGNAGVPSAVCRFGARASGL